MTRVESESRSGENSNRSRACETSTLRLVRGVTARRTSTPSSSRYGSFLAQAGADKDRRLIDDTVWRRASTFNRRCR